MLPEKYNEAISCFDKAIKINPEDLMPGIGKDMFFAVLKIQRGHCLL
jgi:hypothetical protein